MLVPWAFSLLAIACHAKTGPNNYLNNFTTSAIVCNQSLSSNLINSCRAKAVVSNHVPWRAESMQVSIPTNHYTSDFTN